MPTNNGTGVLKLNGAQQPEASQKSRNQTPNVWR